MKALSFRTMENICTGIATSVTVYWQLQECTKGTGLPFVPVPVYYRYCKPTYVQQNTRGGKLPWLKNVCDTLLCREKFHSC